MMMRLNPLLIVEKASNFMEYHAPEFALALGWARLGREDPDVREFCADKIEALFDKLEELYERITG